jgi:hypothetical protein
MRKKSLIVLGICLAMLSLQSCKSKPEQSLLNSYFNAIRMNDITTMASMAVDPMRIEAESWKIVQVSEEKIEPSNLRDLNQKEIDLKKQFEASSAPAIDANEALMVAKDEFTAARTAAAKAAAKAKQEEAQKKYDAAYEANRALLRNSNDAKEAAAKEEEIMAFSLGLKQLSNIRELTGDVASKEVQIEVKTKDGQTKNIKIFIKKYTMKDEAAGLVHRGQWKITKFETL